MKIAITGAKGFVGTHLVRYLSKNNEIIAFNRQEQKKSGKVQYIFWDLNDENDYKGDFDIFVHCAADTGYEKSKEDMIKNNVEVNRNILKLVNASSCKHLIYVSSSSVYQGLSGKIGKDVKIKRGNLKNSYSLTKYLSEEYVKKYLRKGISLTILRPRAIYGEGDRALVPNILKNQLFGRLLLPGDGKNLTSITDINYFVKYIEDVLINHIYGVCNVSSGIDSYENLYHKIVSDYHLKGIIKVPIWIFKVLSFFNKNKYSYIIDTFGRDKVLVN